MNILVSACLLGVPCRYDGRAARAPLVEQLAAHHQLVPVCPEQLGGLPTPRPPAERTGARILTRGGEDVTEAYYRGAAQALRIAQITQCTHAVLKSKSPSCGCGQIYDGSFSGRPAGGNGVVAELLLRAGLTVTNEIDLTPLK